jgi:hypothetical protein
MDHSNEETKKTKEAEKVLAHNKTIKHSRNIDTESAVTDFFNRRRFNSTMNSFAADYRDENLSRDYRSV